MKKRIGVLLMAICLMLSAVFLSVAAQETKPVHMAFYCGSAAADGNLSEMYLFYGGEGTFDALWSNNTLFLAVKTGGEALTVTLNETHTFTGTGDTVELGIPFADFGLKLTDYSQTVPMKLTLGETVIYDGLLGFSGGERLQKFTSFSGGIVTSSNNKVSSVTNGIRMEDRYVEGTDNKGNGRIYQYKPDLSAYSDRSKTFWLEFDYYAASMPVVTVGDPVDNTFTNWGFSLWMTYAKNAGAGFGIVNTEDGLAGVAGAKHSESYRSFSLGKELGDTFHVALGWTPDDVMLVYIDGQLVASMDDVIIHSAGAFINNGIYMSLWRRNSAPAGTADDYDITLTNITVGNGYGTGVLDGLTQETLLGSNPSADNICGNLNMPASLDNGQMDSVKLTWTSSDPDVIAIDGTVTPATQDKTVTVTATVTGTAISKSFTVTVPKLTLKAAIAGTALNRDGVLSDSLWFDRTPLRVRSGENAPAGTVSALWDASNLYLGVAHNGAKTLTVKLGQKRFVLDLTTETFGENTMGAAAAVTAVNAEITVPFASLGLQPSDYNRLLTAIEVELAGDNGTVKLAEDPIDLFLSGNVAETVTGFHNYCTVQMSGGSAAWNIASGGSGRLGAMNKTWMNRERDITLVQTLCITNLPVIDGSITSDWKLMDRYFFFLHLQPNKEAIDVSIYNAGEGKLKLRIANGLKDNSAPAAIDLGVSLGDTFRLETQWRADDSLHIFVDGQWKGSFQNAGYVNGYSSSNSVLDLYYFSSGSTASFTVSGLGVVTNACETLANEITKEAIFGDSDLTNVTENLPLAATFQSAYLGAIPLTWESSDESVIATDGTVTQPEGKAPAKVELKLCVGGQQLWTVTATVPGKAQASAVVPSVIDAAFCGNGISADGKITELGWNMNGTVPGTGAVFGAMWNTGSLYLAFEGSAAPTNLILAGKTVDLSGAVTAGGITELTVSLESLGITVMDYGVTIPASVTMDGGTWNGTLRLTSAQRYDSDNSAHRFGANMGTTGLAYTDSAHAGAVRTSDGWNLYNLYDMSADSSAVGRNRVYAIFQRDNEIVSALSDRSASTYIEFDLRINSMPMTTASESTGWDKLSPCYGFNWYAAGSYFMMDEVKSSHFIAMGVFYTKDGLTLAVRTDEGTKLLPLNRQLGDLFRLGMIWQPDGTLVVYLDGTKLATVENAQGVLDGLGENLISMNMWNKTAPKSRQESTDVYVSGFSVGKYYGESVFESLTFDRIKGENTDQYNITSDLELPAVLSNSQITGSSLVWTSSNPNVISETGKVTIPKTGGEVVTLTATQTDGRKASVEVYVKGEEPTGNVLFAVDDRNPALGVGQPNNSYRFTLDTNANSVIAVLDERQTVNLVTLRDSDAFARLNEEVLTLWVSDDNISYTRVEDFKLLHQGNRWYLYDFEATGKYIKVHYTINDNTTFTAISDTSEASFIGVPAESIITASYSDELAGSGFPNEQTVTVTNTAQLGVSDGVWQLEGEYQQVWLDGRMLYHYTENGKTFVRIPDVAAGQSLTLTVLSGKTGAMDISNKEYVYEVSYGTRSHSNESDGVFMCALPNGTVLGINGDEDGNLFRSFSYDGGLTWVENEPIDCAAEFINGIGGFIYDSHTGRIIFQGHYYEKFDEKDESQSYCQTRFIYSDDNGKSWQRLAVLESDSNYVLSYSDGVELSCYDGSGPNVDFVLPVGAQYIGGSFCSRVGYTTDGGLTWQTSETKITLGDTNTDRAESGLSEGTILEREDGVLVLYARSQSAESQNFAIAYSYDHGITWTQAENSSVYTVNTQPILFRYNTSDLLIWSGNNILGGQSYARAPLSIATSHDGMETFANIQDLYAKTYLQAMTKATLNQCNNPSVTKLRDEDTLLISWTLHHAIYTDKLIRTRIENFTDWLYRTKGAYDSFEHGTVKYEGWSTVSGIASVTDSHHTEGSYAMELSVAGSVVRSVPYLTEGIVSMNLYTADGNLSVELQSTHSPVYGKGSPAGFLAENGSITFLGAQEPSGLALESNAWNTIVFDISQSGVTLSVNGSEPVAMPWNTDIGNYVTYVYLRNLGDPVYVDEFMVQDLELGAAPVYAVEAVKGKIESIGEVTLDDAKLIEEARAAYDALTEEQKALVTNYDVLVASEAALKALQNALPKISGNLSLNETIDINFIIPAGIDVEENVLVVKDAATGEDVEYTILPGIGGTTVVRYSAKANHMTDEITVQVFDAEGNPLTQMASMSVRKYAGIRLPVAEDTEKMMLIRMLDYGALAQINSGVTTDLANSIVTDDLRSFANAYDWADAVALEVPDGSGGVFKAGLALNETIDVTVYTAATNVAEGDKFVVKCNGEELAEDQYIVRLLDDGRYVIRYSVKSNEMSDEIYIAIVGEDNTVKAETTLGVRIYAQKFLAAVPTGNQAAMLLAMLDYGALAQIYAGSTENLANCFVTDTLRQVLISYPWPAN